ncbi:MAG: glycoside hydrolase family 9 protein [Bacteroidota bacterium]
MTPMRLPALLVLFFTLLLLTSCGDAPTEVGSKTNTDNRKLIHLNQLGYYPDAPKKAIFIGAQDIDVVQLVDVESKEKVAEIPLSNELNWEMAGDRVRVADFSSVKTEGTYQLEAEGFVPSHPFEIKNHLYADALTGSVKGLYYQRASTALEEKHAGQWKRPLGHPDDQVLFHASSGQSTGTTNSSKGWYDAGDFNKYIVNGCFSLGQLLTLAEQYPKLFGDSDLNLPESGNGVNDYLDELKYELDWAMSMQDKDGGLFHKLTTKRFEGVKMPHEATNDRYIVGKGTAASLDFAAAMAQAHRVFLEVDPAYAQQCLSAAERAWEWSVKNPQEAYRNPSDVQTGEYGDENFKDERYWAAAELYVSTQKSKYLDDLVANMPNNSFKTNNGWQSYMSYLGMYSLLSSTVPMPDSLRQKLRQSVLAEADQLAERCKALDYFQPIDRFVWGSNSDVLNAAMLMANAYRLDPKPEYLGAIQETVDYIFGKNPVGMCYLTGFGDKSPMFIHHRQSMADGIDEPVPGLLSGGPNIVQQDTSDGTTYPPNVAPMKSWVDQESSYASNEICLNWNAPLTYVLGFLEAQNP